MKWALTLLFCALVATSALADNALSNPGFESGALSPWFNSADFCGGCTWSVTNSDAHSGSYSAFVSGNRLIEQDFAPIAVSDISEVSLWLRMPSGSSNIAAVYFLYSDSTTAENIVSLFSNDWTYFNMTSFLDAGKSLAGFGVYGCTGCDSPTTFADDFLVQTQVPEPSSLLLFGSGLIGAAGAIRRKLSI